MQAITMTYKGFCFDANPAYIKAEYSKNIASKSVLFKSAKQQEISFKAAKIKGNGKFVGSNAGEKAHELIKVFQSKGSSFLFSHDLPPMRAYFSSLDISYNAVEELSLLRIPMQKIPFAISATHLRLPMKIYMTLQTEHLSALKSFSNATIIPICFLFARGIRYG